MPLRGRGLGRGRSLGATPRPTPEPTEAQPDSTTNETTTATPAPTAPVAASTRGSGLRGRGLARGRGRGIGQRSVATESGTTPIAATVTSTPDVNNNKPVESTSTSISRPTRGGGLRGRGSLRGRGAARTAPTEPLSSSSKTLTQPPTASTKSSGETMAPSQLTTLAETQLSELAITTADDEITPNDSASQVGCAAPKVPQTVKADENTKKASEEVRSTTEVSSAKLEGKNSTTTGHDQSASKTGASVSDFADPAEPVEFTGKLGTATKLCTNFIRLIPTMKDIKFIYQYAVLFKPPCLSPKTCTRLLYGNDTPEIFDENVGKIYDSRSILYCAKDIIPEGKEELVLTSTSRENVKYEITVKRAIKGKTGDGKIPVDSPKMVPVYNTILGKIQKEMNLIPIRDSYYSTTREKRIPMHGIAVWPGYTATIQQQVAGLMLMVDLSFKVVRNQTISSIFSEIRKKASGQDFKNQCLRALVGQTIITKYNNKNYRIDDIDWNCTPAAKFTYGYGDNTREITFAEYYLEQYQLKIKDMKQPMLINRPKKKNQRNTKGKDTGQDFIFLVPELCSATGLTDAMRCDFKVMQELAKTTRVKPDVRNEELVGFLNDIHAQEYAQTAFAKWGLRLAKNPATIDGRNIHNEEIICGKGVKKPVNAQADFGNIVTKSPMLDAITLKNWVAFYEKKDEKKIKEFVSCYIKCARQLAQTVEKPTLVMLPTSKTDVMSRAISEHLTKVPDTQLVLNFMASKREDKYNATKKICCIQSPVPSQCIVSRTLPDDVKNNKFSSVTQKVALQINAKLGGSLWAVKIPINNMMLCGIDVWHGATATSKRASVAGLVASYDDKYTKWYSRALFQDSADHEISNKLHMAFNSALKNYHAHNATLPETIVIFRDGISDGEIPSFKDQELKAFKRSIKTFGEDYNPKLCIIIVSKRINVRMYSIKGNTLDNPMPGTVMDQKVTKPYYKDFYLVSQYVRQGTVTPSHFIVVENSAGNCAKGPLTADHIQKLSYKLTHMYYNWPGTVRVPAPCQYAHKLSALVGENIQQEPNNDLAEKLYYL